MDIAVIAVPYDAGRRSIGVGLGPARLLESGLAITLRAAGHTVRDTTVEMPDYAPAHELARVTALQRELGGMVRMAIAGGEFPVVLAGNCSTAVGTLAAAPAGTAVIWFDAHADFNTAETTTTGMLDGLALSMITGRALRNLTTGVEGFVPIREDHVVLVGARDLDPPEEKALSASRITRVAADAASASLGAALRALSPPVRQVYVHLDLDVLDPARARANRYAAPGGLSPSELVRALTAIADVATVYALAVTAYDPVWDRDGATQHAAVDAILAVVAPPDR